jgi:hypothetical protein
MVAGGEHYQLRAAIEVLVPYRVIGRSAWVTASKLCARKRPKLIPVLDRVVTSRLPASEGRYWRTYQALLTVTIQDELMELASIANADHGAPDLSDLSALRVLNTLVWMAHSKAARKTRALWSDRSDT